MRKIIFISILLFTGLKLKSQINLNLETNSKCELFATKGNFDKQDRLKEIKKLSGQLVTVYLVKGKNNKVKNKYTGRISTVLIDKPDMKIDNVTKVLTVTTENENGQMIAHFPLTYDKGYRIYLTECLKE